MRARKGTVYLVGAGPGDPGLITWRGLQMVRTADVLVYDRLVSPELILETSPASRRIYVGKAASRHALPQVKINELLAREASAGYAVCRLKGGDPFLFGRGGEEADHLAERGIPFVVVPGVTSALAVPAYAGIPVTDRRVASSVTITTGRGDVERTEPAVNWRAFAGDGTLVILMGVKNLSEITGELLASGRPGSTPAAAIRMGTTGRQQTIVSDLSHLAEEASRCNLTPPAVLVIGEVVRMRQRLSWFEGRPLAGLRVLVPRPPHQASELAERLREAGAEPLAFPLIRIEPLPVDLTRVRAVLTETWEWVIFTSANGVAAFAHHLLEAGLDWRSLAGARLAAIGPGTARALQECKLRPDFVPSRAIAESLAEELPDICPGARVLLPRAKEARDVLPEILAGKGARVEALPVYRTLPEEEGAAALTAALKEDQVDVVVLTSSSTARALVEAVGLEPLRRCAIASIGPITSQTARELGLEIAIEATTHTMDGLLSVMGEHFASVVNDSTYDIRGAR